MKLCRIGELGKEKPAIIDKDGSYKDLSSAISDLNPENLNFETIEKIKKLNIKDLPTLDANSRIGACVKNPSKFLGIGLNFKDHATEQNLPIPKEPIIFSKFTNCIIGPNDNIEVPKNSNNKPFLYKSWIETKSDGRQDRIIMIKDTDPDSPSFGEDETVII